MSTNSKIMQWLQAPKAEPIRRTNKLWTTMGETHKPKARKLKGAESVRKLSDIEGD